MTAGSGNPSTRQSRSSIPAAPVPTTDDEWMEEEFRRQKARLRSWMPNAPDEKVEEMASQATLNFFSMRKQAESAPARVIQPSHYPAAPSSLIEPAVLSTHVPYKVSKAFRESITPLSTDSMPQKRSLLMWWKQVELACRTIHHTMPDALTAAAIEQIAPIICGPYVWQLLAHRTYPTWRAFKAAVTSECGLSEEEEVGSFFAMQPQVNETDSSFVLRIEARRKLLKVAETATLYSFMPRMSQQFRAQVDWMTLTNQGEKAQLAWEDVVGLARRASFSLRWAEQGQSVVPVSTGVTPAWLSDAAGVQKAGSTPASEQPAPLQRLGALPVQNRTGAQQTGSGPGNGSGSGSGQVSRGSRGQARCSLCLRLGVGLDTHSDDDCWINPNSKVYKPEVRQRRLEMAEARGITIPEDIKAMAPYTSQKRPAKRTTSTGVGTSGMLSETEVRSMVANICTGGRVHELDAELLVSQLLDSEDELPVSMHAAITHVSDGPVGNAHFATTTGADTTFLDHLINAAPVESKDAAKRLREEIEALTRTAERVLAQVDAGAQTGGVPGSGRVVRGGTSAGSGRASSPDDLLRVLNRIRISLPILKQVKMDEGLRKLLLAELVQEEHRQGLTLVIPQNQLVQRLTDDEFKRYRELIQGITPDNQEQVRAKLVEMGVIPGVGSVDTQPSAEDGPERPAKRTRLEVDEGGSGQATGGGATSAANLVSDLVAHLSKAVNVMSQLVVPDLLASVATQRKGGLALGDVPTWAAGFVDARKSLWWDSEQFIAPVAVNKVLTLAIVDTGSCQTLLDVEMARDLHLGVKVAHHGEFGCYMVPGASELKAYYGMVDGPFELQVAEGVVFTLRGIRVVQQASPLFLLGADVLRGGRAGNWNFAAIRTRTVGAGEVVGELEFERDGEVRKTPLAHTPAAGAERFASSMLGTVTGGLVANVNERGAVDAPQYVRPLAR